MAEITTKYCAVAVESVFKTAVLFKDAQCEIIAQKCLEAFASYGLKPAQIVLRAGDPAFNYDVTFSLFNGNGTFRFSAEKVDVNLQNATSEKDLEIVQDCLAKIYEHIPLPEITITTISANAQTTFASTDAVQEYMLKHADPTRHIVSGGTIAYIRLPDWPEEIRLVIDRSIVYPAGLFLMWTTTHRGSKISRDVLKSVKDAFEQAVTKFDLTFPKPI